MPTGQRANLALPIVGSMGSRLAATTTFVLVVATAVLFSALAARDWRNTIAAKQAAASMVLDVVANELTLDSGDAAEARRAIDTLHASDEITGVALWMEGAQAPTAEWHRQGTDVPARLPATLADDRIEVSKSLSPARGAAARLVVRFSMAHEIALYRERSAWLLVALLLFAVVTAALLNLIVHLQVATPHAQIAAAVRGLEDAIRARHAAAARVANATEVSRYEAPQRFRNVVEAMPDAIAISQGGRIQYANPAFLTLIDSSVGDARGRDLSDLVAMASPSTTPTASAHDARDEVWTTGGRVMTVEARRLAIVIDGIDSSVLVARDVTEQHRLREELAHTDAERRRDHKMEAIGRLAGGIAHDFNNMLSVILGYTSILVDELPAGDDLIEPLQEMKLAAERSADLTRQLLAFSRRQPLEAQATDLNGAVATGVKMAAHLLGNDIRVETTLTAEPCTIELDAGQVEQIILHLALNSRDAMPKGGTLTFETKVGVLRRKGGREVCPGSFAILVVSDNGTGMDKDVKERMFEPFFTTKEQGKGTGLGLSTVFGIVRQSGGEIQVATELGRGTRLEIYFPRRTMTKPDDLAPRHRSGQPIASLQNTMSHDTLPSNARDALDAPHCPAG